MPEEQQDPSRNAGHPRDDVDDYIFRKEEEWSASQR